MGARVLFAVVALCVAVQGMLFLVGPEIDVRWHYGVLLFMAVVLFLLFRRVIKPQHTVVKGMELISAQDFNNRLIPVGERNSDKIVNLFNTMIDKLRYERLWNLEQEGFLKLLVEASPMGVGMLDFDGRFVMANDAFLKITGIKSEAELTGKTLVELQFDLRDSMAGVPLGENRVVTRGDIRMYRCYHLNFVQSGFKRGFYLLESLTEEVMKAERAAYEKVIRIISHEVNNTMGGVRSVLDTLCDVTDDDDIKAVIESCDNRCEQMCGFISSYADVVKVPQPVISRVDLVEDIRKLMPFLREMVREEIRLDYQPQRESMTAEYDKTLMQQVVVNIVKNAAESIEGEGGFIRIEVSSEDGRPVLDIANNGAVITEEVARHLFRPFFSTKKEGRGLGLTLIGEILNRHGVRFSLRSGADGLTRFRMVFPR